MKLRKLAVISVFCALATLALRAQLHKPADAPALKQPIRRTPTDMRRATEFTFLTFPEWYLVYSPDEYADFVIDRPPSQFPYLGHLNQFWQGYGAIYDASADKYPFNTDYHVMIGVIGTSTSVEYGLKWMYECVVGRVTENLRGNLTAEDHLAAKVAREYVDYLDVEPWYKFDFVNPLKRVWTETGFWGPDPVRKWERKYILTTEYTLKAAYGWVIKKASESAYEEEKPVSAVVLDRFPSDLRPAFPEVKVLNTFADGNVLAQLPRYQAFTTISRSLAKHGINFVEIVGNKDVILVSAVVPVDFDDSNLTMVMTQPIMTRPGRQRIVFTVTVPELCAMIRRLDQGAFKLEHIYDY